MENSIACGHSRHDQAQMRCNSLTRRRGRSVHPSLPSAPPPGGHGRGRVAHVSAHVSARARVHVRGRGGGAPCGSGPSHHQAAKRSAVRPSLMRKWTWVVCRQPNMVGLGVDGLGPGGAREYSAAWAARRAFIQGERTRWLPFPLLRQWQELVTSPTERQAAAAAEAHSPAGRAREGRHEVERLHHGYRA